MPEPTTIGEWSHAGFNMEWSIINQEDFNAYREIVDQGQEPPQEQWNNIRLDLRAPKDVPDGTYKVLHQSTYGKASAQGLVIKDGMFLAVPTEQAVFEAVCKSNRRDPEKVRARMQQINHIYIEDFSWNNQVKCLEVGTGS